MRLAQGVLTFSLILEFCIIWLSSGNDQHGYGPQPCSNGSAIFNVSMKNPTRKGFDAYCMPYDNCSRYCYDAENCSLHAKAPPNKQIVLTKINFTLVADHLHYEFRCCASSLRLRNCKWTDVNGEINVDPENNTISDFKVLDPKKRRFSVKICEIDRDAGQKPTAVCYADVCHADGVCKGKYEPTNRYGTMPNGVTVDYTADPYGLLALAALFALAAIPTGCKDFVANLINAVVYSKRAQNGYSTVGSTAIVTCAANYYVSITNMKTQVITCQSKGTWMPETVTCVMGCPIPAAPAMAQYTPAPVVAAPDTSVAPGTTADLMCTGTSTLTGQCGTTQTVTCTSGQFVPTAASCVASSSLPVTMGTYGSGPCGTPPSQTLAEGLSTTLTCSTGDYVMGQGCSNTIMTTCTGGILNPTVTAKTCAAPCTLPTITTASYDAVPCGMQLSEGSTTKVTCDNGFYVAGKSTCADTFFVTTCTNGVLTAPVSAKPRVPGCPIPTITTATYDAAACGNFLPEGATTKITCDSTFFLVGKTTCADTSFPTTCTGAVLITSVPVQPCVVGCVLPVVSPLGSYDVPCAVGTAQYTPVGASVTVKCSGTSYVGGQTCAKTVPATCAATGLAATPSTVMIGSTTCVESCTPPPVVATIGGYATVSLCDTTQLEENSKTTLTCISPNQVTGAACNIVSLSTQCTKTALATPLPTPPCVDANGAYNGSACGPSTGPQTLPETMTTRLICSTPGYFVTDCTGYGETTCTSGIQTPAVACTQSCSLPVVTDGAFDTTVCPDQTVPTTQYLLASKSATFTCSDGFYLPVSSATSPCFTSVVASCDAAAPPALTYDTTLTTTSPSCNVTDTGSYDSNVCGTLSLELPVGGSTVLTCSQGYYVAGGCVDTTTTVTCPGGLLTPPAYSCVKYCQFGANGGSLSGTFDCSTTDILQFDSQSSTATFTCDSGYADSDRCSKSSPLSCPSGVNTGSTSCASVDCVGSVTNGNLGNACGSDVVSGKTATYTCTDGYMLTGSECVTTGDYSCSNAPYTCAKYCQVTDLPVSKAIFYSGPLALFAGTCATKKWIEVGKLGYVTCNTGYTVHGQGCNKEVILSCSTATGTPTVAPVVTTITCDLGCALPVSTGGKYTGGQCGNLLPLDATTTLTCTNTSAGVNGPQSSNAVTTTCQTGGSLSNTISTTNCY